jgi:hypothetical protein
VPLVLAAGGKSRAFAINVSVTINFPIAIHLTFSGIESQELAAPFQIGLRFFD